MMGMSDIQLYNVLKRVWNSCEAERENRPLTI